IPRAARCARVDSQSSTSIAKWLDDTIVGRGVTVKWTSPLPSLSWSCRLFSAGPRSRNSAPSTRSYHARVRSRSLIWTFTWWIILMAINSLRVSRSDALVGSAPVVLKDDLLERPAPDRAELPHGVTDRQDRIRVNARREAERGFSFLLVKEVPRRQGGAESQRASRQQHVLHRWIDRRAGAARRRRRAFLEARDDPHGSFVEVIGQVFH